MKHYKEYYRVIFEDRNGYTLAKFYKAHNIFFLVNYVDTREPYHIKEIKEYKTMPKTYEGERIDPNTITEI